MESQRLPLRPLDLLVVVAILLVAGSLLLPATVSVGRVNVKVRCEGNLRAIGTALLSYADNKTYPPGILSGIPSSTRFDPRYQRLGEVVRYVATGEVCDNPDVTQTSGLTLILPFLGETTVHDAFNLSVACCAVQNATSVSARIKAFICPANPLEFVPGAGWGYYRAPPNFGPIGPGQTDYAFASGGAGIISAYNNPVWAPNWYGTAPGWVGVNNRAIGPFNVNKNTLTTMIKDGSRYTFVMGEAVGSLPVGLRADGRPAKGNDPISVAHENLLVRTPWSQGFLGGPPQVRDGRLVGNHGGFGSVLAITAWNAWYDRDGNLTSPDKWFVIPPNEGDGRMARPTWYRESSPHKALNYFADDGSAIPGDIGCVQGFRSSHPTVPMLFADGSVKQIKPTIDPKIWVGLSTIQGREPIPDDF